MEIKTGLQLIGQIVGIACLTGIMLVMGCAAPPIDQALNKGMAKRHAPLRYALDPTRSSEKKRFFNEIWAGEPGESHLNKRYRSMVFKQVEDYCDLPRSAFVEARGVSFSKTYIEEVWVFRDPLSKRKDGLSGQTVILKYDPQSDHTDVSFVGACHTGGERTFSSSR